MRDRGIGHQTLDIGLADPGDRADEHRHDRKRRDDLAPVADDMAEGVEDQPRDQRHGRDLGCGGKKGGDRRRRAFVDVGRPHVERHRRDLEGQPDQHEHQTEQHAQRQVTGIHGADDALEAGGADKAVNQRGAIKKQARAERAQHEIFQAGLGRAHRVAPHRSHDVKRQRLQLQTHVKDQQITGRDHDHHADDRQGDDDRELEPQHVAALHVVGAHREHGGGGNQHHHLGKAREAVVDEHAVEGRLIDATAKTHHGGDHQKGRDRGPEQGPRQRVLAKIGPDKQRDQRITREHRLGQNGREIERGHPGPLSDWPAPRRRVPRAGFGDSGSADW